MQGWISPADSLALPIDAWGDGARTAFKLLAPLIALANRVTPEPPGIVLWEEPELFQNPKTLHKLLREVVEIVRGKPIQLFMVSHSLEVVAHLAGGDLHITWDGEGSSLSNQAPAGRHWLPPDRDDP